MSNARGLGGAAPHSSRVYACVTARSLTCRKPASSPYPAITFGRALASDPQLSRALRKVMTRFVGAPT